MITIYMVCTGAYDENWPRVAFTTRELADAHAGALGGIRDDVTVVELQLLDHPPKRVSERLGEAVYEYEKQ